MPIGSVGKTPLKLTNDAVLEASDPLLKEPPVPPPVRFAPFGWKKYTTSAKLNTEYTC